MSIFYSHSSSTINLHTLLSLNRITSQRIRAFDPWTQCEYGSILRIHPSKYEEEKLPSASTISCCSLKRVWKAQGNKGKRPFMTDYEFPNNPGPLEWLTYMSCAECRNTLKDWTWISNQEKFDRLRPNCLRSKIAQTSEVTLCRHWNS